MEKTVIKTLVLVLVTASLPTTCSAVAWQDVAKRIPAAVMTGLMGYISYNSYKTQKQVNPLLTALKDPNNTDVLTTDLYQSFLKETEIELPGFLKTPADQQKEIVIPKITKISDTARLGLFWGPTLAALFGYITYNPLISDGHFRWHSGFFLTLILAAYAKETLHPVALPATLVSAYLTCLA
jgi:hypothetical protein